MVTVVCGACGEIDPFCVCVRALLLCEDDERFYIQPSVFACMRAARA